MTHIHDRDNAEYLVVPPSLGTPDEARRAVREAEADFDRRLTELSAAVSRDCASGDVRILRLTGPTCSGKTTAARKLTEALETTGLSVYPISLDDFYIDRRILQDRARKEGGQLDYDSAETLDLEALRVCIRELLACGETDLPVYDFGIGSRADIRRLHVPAGQKPVFLFEGIQALYPAVTELLAGVPVGSVYISALHGLEVAGIRFSPVDLRLMRRMVRDEAVRNASPDFTLALWNSVRKNEETAILPFADSCDYFLDSTMPFEPHMLKPHMERLLRTHPVEGTYAAQAARLLSDLTGVEGIPSSWLPDGALYREFIPMSLEGQASAADE